MIMATVIGTLRSIPVIPQSDPQRAKERIATNGLIFSVFPINLGSTKLPTSVAIVPAPNKMIRKGTNSPNWINENSAGRTVPMIGPTDGMKLNTKIRNAQNRGESIPTASKTK